MGIRHAQAHFASVYIYGHIHTNHVWGLRLCSLHNLNLAYWFVHCNYFFRLSVFYGSWNGLYRTIAHQFLFTVGNQGRILRVYKQP
jgi:hypothetical protein